MYEFRQKVGFVFSSLLKIIVALIFIFPFLWMISLAFQTDSEVMTIPCTLIPSSLQWKNFVQAWNSVPFVIYIRNSLVTIVAVIVLQSIVMVPAAYAFAKFRFKGQSIMFGLIMIAFMMPNTITFLPTYYLMTDLGWMDTLWPQIIPFMTNAFGIFLLRQYFMQVPDELLESARLDKASEFQILSKIMLPMSKAGISAIALFSFISHWNGYFWPLIMTNSDEVRPLPIGVMRLKDTEGNFQWNVIMAGNMFLVVPVLIVYMFASQRIISSFAYRGIK